jgi:hypothetical protein
MVWDQGDQHVQINQGIFKLPGSYKPGAPEHIRISRVNRRRRLHIRQSRIQHP